MNFTLCLRLVLPGAAAVLLLAGCGEESDPTPGPQAESAPETAAPADNSQEQRAGAPVSSLPDFTGLVRAAAPSVVNISSAQAREQGTDEPPPTGAPFEDWFRRFFEEREQPGRGPQRPSLGSGFLISKSGYILTNRHVVNGKSRILVKLNDGRQMTAELIGSDEYSDIALLKIEADDLPAANIGVPADLEVGSWVVAIGSPFGFETSVTAGIVSAKKRSLADDQYVPFIQTDVAINPGNSGGPLFNLDGEVVGINAQIYSRNGGFQGVSFAIPIDVAMDVADQLRDGGTVMRGWLGVQIQEVDLALAESFGMARPEGALVTQVLPDSPAEEAGLMAGDVILSFDGRPVADAAGLPPLVGLTPPEESADVELLRQGERKTISVTVGELEQDRTAGAQSPGDSAPAREQDLGLAMRELSADERSQLGVEDGGVWVEQVNAGPGKKAGLQAGDVIVAVGARKVGGVADLRRQLAASGGPVALRVLREGSARYLPLDPG